MDEEKRGGGRFEERRAQGVDGTEETKRERLQVQGKRRRESVAE